MAPGEVVEPAPAVVEVPEGDAGDDVGVVAEEPEELGVLGGLTVDKVGGAAGGERVGPGDLIPALAAVGPPAGQDIEGRMGPPLAGCRRWAKKKESERGRGREERKMKERRSSPPSELAAVPPCRRRGEGRRKE